MTGHERTVWDVITWCEARSIPAPQWAGFADWYATTGKGLAFYSAYELWRSADL